jgi:hypothetical protein
MKWSRFTEEQIIAILREQEAGVRRPGRSKVEQNVTGQS